MIFIQLFLYAAFAMQDRSDNERPPPPHSSFHNSQLAHSIAMQSYLAAHTSALHALNQFDMQHLQNTPVHQNFETTWLQAPMQAHKYTSGARGKYETNWLQNKNQFIRSIKMNLVLGLREELNSIHNKERIVQLFNSLDVYEIMSLSRNNYGTKFISTMIKYVGGDLVDRFMEKLNNYPQSIGEIGAHQRSHRVIINLILLGEGFQEKYKEIVWGLKDRVGMSPWVIQKLVQYVPNYKTSLLEDMKRGRFPHSKLLVEHLPFLRMYSWQDIGDLVESERADVGLKRKISEQRWSQFQAEGDARANAAQADAKAIAGTADPNACAADSCTDASDTEGNARANAAQAIAGTADPNTTEDADGLNMMD